MPQSDDLYKTVFRQCYRSRLSNQVLILEANNDSNSDIESETNVCENGEEYYVYYLFCKDKTVFGKYKKVKTNLSDLLQCRGFEKTVYPVINVTGSSIPLTLELVTDALVASNDKNNLIWFKIYYVLLDVYRKLGDALFDKIICKYVLDERRRQDEYVFKVFQNHVVPSCGLFEIDTNLESIMNIGHNQKRIYSCLLYTSRCV